MFTFRNAKPYKLPLGCLLELHKAPSPRQLNRLLSKCNAETYSPKKLALALENSFCNLSIFREQDSQLLAFVRITTDKGLNANLWDLASLPGENQNIYFSILIYHALGIIKRNLPGCSVSVAAPSSSIKFLEDEGFIIDPSGIRAMAYRIR